MNRISSWYTTFQQFFPPIAGLLISTLWFFAAFSMNAAAMWAAAVIMTVIVLLLIGFAPRYRHVWVDATHITISNGFRVARVSLATIKSVTEHPRSGLHYASIEFDHLTPFGTDVRFIPKIRLIRTGYYRWKRIAPAVEELASAAHATYVNQRG